MSQAALYEAELIVDTDIKGVNDDAFALHYLLTQQFVPSLITTCSGNTLASDSLVDTGSLLASYAVETETRAGPDCPRGWTPAIHEYHRRLRKELGDSAYLGELGSPRTHAVAPDTDPATGPALTCVSAAPAADYLALGPLGNLHHALESGALPAARIRHLVFSGGAFGVPGNVGRRAEFNVIADPLAAAGVFSAPLERITVVPLDVTSELTYGLTQFRKIATGSGPLSRDLVRTKGATFGEHPNFREPLWDLVAALVLTDPAVVTHSVRGEVSVDTSLTSSLGATTLRPSDHGRVQVVVEVDTDRVLRHMADTFKGEEE